jgi:cell division protein FtsZ
VSLSEFYCTWTLPFLFEGKCQGNAKIGIEKLRKQVDSLIVINNNKLREVYGNLGFKAGFQKRMKFGNAKRKVMHHILKYRFIDAKTVLSNSGTTIMVRCF